MRPSFALKRARRSDPTSYRSQEAQATTPPPLSPARPNLPAGMTELVARPHLFQYGQHWLDNCRGKGHSPRTLEFRIDVVKRMDWYLEHVGAHWCSYLELRGFLGHVRNGHEEPGGRWGDTSIRQNRRPVRPLTVHRYWRELSAWFKWMEKEHLLKANSMEHVDQPEQKQEPIPHLTVEHIRALLNATQQTSYPLRNAAILMLLLDTGLRASELCNVRFENIDLFGRQLKVVNGKGNKSRTVPFSQETASALRHYVRREISDNLNEVPPSTPLFLAERGAEGASLSRHGLRMLIRRLGQIAGLPQGVVKCSPHVFRHTFAFLALDGGASERTLREMLGHTTLHMTHKYVNLSESDLQRAHERFTPVGKLQLTRPTRKRKK